MALYTIGDPHLSLGSGKPMDVFGGAWAGYVDKLREGFSVVQPEDTVVICGDISWGMSLPEARQDFAFLDGLPGRKLLLKGNHWILGKMIIRQLDIEVFVYRWIKKRYLRHSLGQF